MSRRTISIAIIVAVFAALWSWGWYFLAGYADRRADRVLKEMAAHGITVDCSDRRVGGFPFAIRIVCGTTAVAEKEHDIRTKLAGLNAGVSVFAPLTARISMVAPVNVETTALVGPTDLRFDAAALKVGVGVNGPRDVRFDATNLLADFQIPNTPRQSVQAATANGSLAPSKNGGSDIALRFTNLALSVGGKQIPPFGGTLRSEISVPPRALIAGRAALQAPLAARAIEVRLESGGAILEVEGDLSVDADGVIDGTLVLRMAGTQALPAFIAALPKEWFKIGNGIAGGLIMFGTPAKVDGKPASEMRIEIRHGRAIAAGGLIDHDLPRVPL